MRWARTSAGRSKWAHAVLMALLVGLAACSSKDDDDGGTDNPNGPSGESAQPYHDVGRPFGL